MTMAVNIKKNKYYFKINLNIYILHSFLAKVSSTAVDEDDDINERL